MRTVHASMQQTPTTCITNACVWGEHLKASDGPDPSLDMYPKRGRK